MTDTRSDLTHGVLICRTNPARNFPISIRDLTSPFDSTVLRCVEGQRRKYVRLNRTNWDEHARGVAGWGVPVVSEQETEYEAGVVNRTVTDVPFSLTVDLSGSVLITRLGVDAVTLYPSPLHGAAHTSIHLDYNQPTRLYDQDTIACRSFLPGKAEERWGWEYTATLYGVRTSQLPRTHLYQLGGKLIPPAIALMGREGRQLWARRLEREVSKMGALGLLDIGSYQAGDLLAEYESSSDVSDDEEEEMGSVHGGEADGMADEGEGIENEKVNENGGKRGVWRGKGHKVRGHTQMGKREE